MAADMPRKKRSARGLFMLLAVAGGSATIAWSFASGAQEAEVFVQPAAAPSLRSARVARSGEAFDASGASGAEAPSASTASSGLAALVGGSALLMMTAAARGRGSSAAKAVQARGVRSSRGARVVAQARLSTSEALEMEGDVLLNNYGKRSLAFSRGEGSYVFDDQGRRFLDFTSGIAVNCLGHSDEGWANAVAEQARTLTHTSNIFLTPPQVELAKKLTSLSFADKAYFCNSGAEANEAAIKFSRKFHFHDGKPREKFVAFENSFHGRTMGALAITWKDKIKTPFQPIMPSAEFLEYNNIEALKAIDESTCAVFCEPLQGEGGIMPGDRDFLMALRRRCSDVGALLVFDEVQCGLGRTGTLFAYENSGVIPDMITLAKPLAGGLPIGAVLMSDGVAGRIEPGDHGSTFAGAPLVCAAACYTLDRVSNQSFLDNVYAMGERLRRGLKASLHGHDVEVRGMGLLTGVVFPDVATCAEVRKAAQDDGLLVLTAGAGNVMRLAPALTVREDEVDAALRSLDKAFKVVLKAPAPVERVMVPA